MTWIKICGITNFEDGMAAAEAGADALGFVFYKKSPRYVDSESVRKITAKLPGDIEKVGVFIDETWNNIQATVARANLTGIQIHADSFQKEAISFRVQRYLALRALDFLDPRKKLEGFIMSLKDTTFVPGISAVFLDSGTTQQPGGTGRAFDWEKATHIAGMIKQAGIRLVVAGGLTSVNVAKAIHILEPWGVDVSSGVEASPGKKDLKKIQAFLATVRQAEKTG